jgi:hypothetical protein
MLLIFLHITLYALKIQSLKIDLTVLHIEQLVLQLFIDLL